MAEMKETKKYVFTVEGETEKWYLDWLCKKINEQEKLKYNVSIKAVVEQHPLSYAKGVNVKAVPMITHICDVESKEKVHVDKFQGILLEMKNAKTQKKIKYCLGYSNFTFELWIILHKRSCNGSFADRTKYLPIINHIFGEKFENLDQYKKEDNFKRCLSKITFDNVVEAIKKADVIMRENEINGKKKLEYKGYSYYEDNPSLNISECIKSILIDNGLIKSK